MRPPPPTVRAVSRPVPSPIDALLSLPATPDLLDRWRAIPSIEVGSDPFQTLYESLLAEYARLPARALEGVLHARHALARVLSPRERALLHRMEANARIGTGDLRGAVRGFQRAFRAFGAARLRHEQGRTTIGWLYALGLCGDLESARRVARQGERLLPKTSRADRARLESNLGNAYLHAGRLGQADKTFTGALRQFQRLGMAGEMSVCRLNLGMNAWMRAELPRARTELTRARDGLARAGNEVLSLYAETGLAALELVSGDRGDTWSRLQDVRRRLREVGDQRALAWSHQELAVVLCSLGAYETAAPEAETAWKIFRQLGYRDEEARAASLRGRILSGLGGNQLAMSLLHEARRWWQSSGCAWAARRVELEQARLLLREGRTAAALRDLRRLVPVLSREALSADAILARGLLAEAYLAEGNPGLAIRLAARAHREAKHHPARWEKPGLAMLSARASSRLDRSSDTMRWMRLAVRELETLLLRFGDHRLRLLIGESRTRLFQDAIELTLRHGGRRAVDLALDLASQARSPTLLEDLHRGEAPRQHSLRAALARLRDEMLRQDGTRTETRHRGLSIELERLAPSLSPAISTSRAALRLAWRDRRPARWLSHLGTSQLVLFDRGERGWRAFVVDRSRRTEITSLPNLDAALEARWIPLRLTLETAAHVPSSERDAFLEQTVEECDDAMATLRRALWEPLSLDPSRAVIAIPAGDLHALPLEAIYESNLPSHAPGAMRLPHPALLARPRLSRPQEGSRTRHAMLLHDRSVGARAEVLAIARLLRSRGWQVEVGSNRDVLARGAGPLDLLHVAAHGAFHREGWLLSGFRLEDGWLGFEHLPRRRLLGALLHFTSCESGRTALFPGTDLEGWMTAGLAAGASGLALALWKVDEHSAAGWSRAFYRRWVAGADPSEAARGARQELSRRWRHPFRSAPFFWVG